MTTADWRDQKCRTCGHLGDDHDAGECWALVEGGIPQQCGCGWLDLPAMDGGPVTPEDVYRAAAEPIELLDAPPFGPEIEPGSVDEWRQRAFIAEDNLSAALMQRDEETARANRAEAVLGRLRRMVAAAHPDEGIREVNELFDTLLRDLTAVLDRSNVPSWDAAYAAGREAAAQAIEAFAEAIGWNGGGRAWDQAAEIARSEHRG